MGRCLALPLGLMMIKKRAHGCASRFHSGMRSEHSIACGLALQSEELDDLMPSPRYLLQGTFKGLQVRWQRVSRQGRVFSAHSAFSSISRSAAGAYVLLILVVEGLRLSSSLLLAGVALPERDRDLMQIQCL